MKVSSGFVRGLVVFVLVTFAADLVAAPPGTKASSAQPGDWRSGSPVIHAAGRGFPWLNFEDGRALPPPALRLSAVDAVLRSASRPLSLAAGDVDSDGMPDLVVGFGTTAGGYLEIHHGNIDFLFPETEEAAERRQQGTFCSAPFLPRVTEIPVPAAPDFLACGDFDDDGHVDIVAGNREQATLLWLRGGSDGNLSPTTLDLPGAVTAMIAGDIATLDGVTDLAVAVNGPDGPSLLVFQSDRGALLDVPAVLSVSSPVTGLALGELDAKTHLGLAAVAGGELVGVHSLPPVPGRKRTPEAASRQQRTIPSQSVTSQQFSFRLDSVAIGDFIWDSAHRQEIAVLGGGLVNFLDANAPASAPAQSTTPQSLGPGSAYSIRRQVSMPVSLAYDFTRPSSFLVPARVSSLPNDDLLVVDSAGQQVSVVLADSSAWKEHRPEAQLPAFAVAQQAIALPVEGSPVAVLPMRLNSDAMHDLVVLRNGVSPISLAVTAASGTIIVNSAGSQSDASSFDTDCDVDLQTPGLQCTLAAALEVANQLPGTELIQFTVSKVSGQNLPTVTSPVTIDGGSSGAARVEIDSSNDGYGLLLLGGKSVVRRMVIHGALDPGGLSGNSAVSFEDNGGNFLEGSFLGTDVTGTQALPNFAGLDLEGPDNTAGGDVIAARNVISGNAFGGVGLMGATRTRVVGNLIGTDVTGLRALGNRVYGLAVGSVLPGGDPSQEIRSLDNTISNNVICATTKRNETPQLLLTGQGILMDGEQTLVVGNKIGVANDGVTALPNEGDGIAGAGGLGVATNVNQINGNTITFNKEDGIEIVGSDGLPKTIGNYRIHENTILSNVRNGVYGGGWGNTISVTANTIASNQGAGVQVTGKDECEILQNSIHSNGSLGIDLTKTLPSDGVTPNDDKDPDTGPNNLQNAPGLELYENGTKLRGGLNSLPNTAFYIEIFENDSCDASGSGEGKKLINSVQCQTDATGAATFEAPFAPVAGKVYTATATLRRDGKVGLTSEFSACAQPEKRLELTPRLIIGLSLCADKPIPLRLTEKPSDKDLTTDPNVEYEWVKTGGVADLLAKAQDILQKFKLIDSKISLPIANIDVKNGQVTFLSPGINLIRAKLKTPAGDIKSNIAVAIGGMDLIKVSSVKITPVSMVSTPANELAGLLTKAFGSDSPLNVPMILFPPSAKPCSSTINTLGTVGLVTAEINFEFFGGLVDVDDLAEVLGPVMSLLKLPNPLTWLGRAIGFLAPVLEAQLLNFKVGGEAASPGYVDPFISVSNDFTSAPFMKGAVSAKASGISCVQAIFDMEKYCLGKATDLMLVWVMPDLQKVEIRNEQGLYEEPIDVPLNGNRGAQVVGMFNGLAQATGAINVSFDPIGESTREKITSIAETMIPGGKDIAEAATVPIDITLPVGATLTDGIYRDGRFYTRLKFGWQPLAATMSFQELRFQVPVPNFVTTWTMDPTPNTIASVDAAGKLTGLKQGLTRTKAEVCITLTSLTKQTDDNGVRVGSGGAIRARKFNDINANGVQDQDEPGLNGWTIRVERIQNGQVKNGITDSTGWTTIGDLEIGTYRIREVAPNGATGWVQTTPNPADLEITGNETKTVIFGNRLPGSLGKITGVKFEDTNGNGVRDAGEPGKGQWRINLNGSQDFRMTADDGSFAFENLQPGDYTVTETPQPFWTQTTPSPGTVKVEGGKTSSVVFGNFKSMTVRVKKFEDLNANGVKDGTERYLPDWPVQIDLYNDGGADQTGTTDATGVKTFVVDPGDPSKPRVFRVSETMQGGWEATTGTQEVFSLRSGQEVEISFGNRPTQAKGTIRVFKFNDKDSNGVQNGAEETALSGWTIEVDGGGLSGDTDEKGVVTFADIEPGKHTVREVSQDGWVAVSSSSVSVTVENGKQASVTFANRQSETACKCDPLEATNKLKQDHVLIVTVTSQGKAVPNVSVKLEVTKGPNAGTEWMAQTDADGKAKFTYTSDKGGKDYLRASGKVGSAGFTCTAVKTWSGGLLLEPRLGFGLSFCADKPVKLKVTDLGTTPNQDVTTDPSVTIEAVKDGTVNALLLDQVLAFFKQLDSRINVKRANVTIANGYLTFNSPGINIIQAKRRLSDGTEIFSNRSAVIGGMELMKASSLKIEPLALTSPVESVIADLLTNKLGWIEGQADDMPMILFPPSEGWFTTCYWPVGFFGDVGYVRVKSVEFNFFGGLIKDVDLMAAFEKIIGFVGEKVPLVWLSKVITIGGPLAVSQMLDFKIGSAPAKKGSGDAGTEDNVVRVNNDYKFWNGHFLKGVVHAKKSGISIVQATLDLEDYCLGKATDNMLVIVLPDLEKVDIRNKDGRPEDPLVVDIGQSVDAHGVGMFNVFSKNPTPIPALFDPLGETTREKINEMAESMLPGKGKWLTEAALPIGLTLPRNATLNQNTLMYDGGHYYFRMKFQWQPLQATFLIDELRIQTYLPNLFNTWALKPTPNPIASMPANGTFKGEKSGLTKIGLDVCIPMMTKRSDENGLRVRGGSIRGIKFRDENGNGQLEDSEKGVPQWIIELNDGQERRITYTDGTFIFDDLPPGTYKVSEVTQPGWVATTPTQLTVQVKVNEKINVRFGNRPETGEILVFKFKDLNRNGVLDVGEPMADGFEFELIGTGQKQTTSEGGPAVFRNLQPKQYTVRETQRAGWYNTTPTSQTVTVNGTSSVPLFFGNSDQPPDTGRIYGIKFEDVDGNGIFNNEPVIDQWPVTLSGTASRTTATDGSGRYDFSSLAAGTYQVNEALPDGWTATTPVLGSIPLMTGGQVEYNFGNFRNMKVRGRKFLDRNRNGVQDQDEPGLPGWTIQVDLHNDGSPDLTTVTDGEGNFSLEVGPGDRRLARVFTVKEVPKTGWLQTAPKAVVVHPIQSGLTVDDANFGNVPIVKLCGTKFNDLNGDGLTAGDSGVSWKIMLDLDGNGQVDKEITTGADGAFCFDDVPPGTHIVKEETRSDWVPTNPASGSRTVKVESDGIAPPPVIFANFKKIRLCGAKFEDVNGNHKRDAGEPGLAGWTIQLDESNNGSVDKTAVTDGSGAYCFDGIGPGNHKLSEVVPQGWIQTFPVAPAYYLVKAESGKDQSGLDFGNRHETSGAEIRGKKYYDLDQDGIRDPREPGLPEWTIFVDANDNGQADPTETSALTDDEGNYVLKDLKAGSHKVREVRQNGWKQTAPSSGVHVVQLAADQKVTDKDFGNVMESAKDFYFPFYQGDAGTFTGFAASNVSDFPATLLFTAHGPDGALLDFPKNPRVFRLKAHNQIARLGNEIFGAPGDALQSGWVHLRSDRPEMGTFFQFSNSTVDRIDGSVAFDRYGKTLHFTRVWVDNWLSTWLSIANPTSGEIKLTLRLVPLWGGFGGAAPAPVNRTIPAKGMLYESVASMFKETEVYGGYVEVAVTEGGGAVGFELVSQTFPRTVIGLNAFLSASATQAFSAQLANGAGIFTSVNFVNVGTQPRNILLTAYDDAGKLLGSSVMFPLGPGEQLEDDTAYILMLDFNKLTVGSVKAEIDGPGVLGDVVFGEANSYTYLAALPMQTEPIRKAAFSQVANGLGYYTGIALFNPGSSPATVTIEVYAKDGTKVGQGQKILGPNERISRLLPELVPQSAGQIGGYVVIQSTQPIVSQQLFGDGRMQMLSAVPPTVIP